MKLLNWFNGNRNLPEKSGERYLRKTERPGVPAVIQKQETPRPDPQEPDKLKPQKRSFWSRFKKPGLGWGRMLGLAAIAAAGVAYGAWTMFNKNITQNKGVLTGFSVTEDPKAMSEARLIHGAAKMVTEDKEGKADTTYFLYPDMQRVELAKGADLLSEPVETYEFKSMEAARQHDRPLSPETMEGLKTVRFSPMGQITARNNALEQDIWGDALGMTAIEQDSAKLAQMAPEAKKLKTDLTEFSNNGRTISMWVVDKNTYYQYVDETIKGGKITKWQPPGWR